MLCRVNWRTISQPQIFLRWQKHWKGEINLSPTHSKTFIIGDSHHESGSTYLQISPAAKSPTGKLNPAPYVGFSFNSLFFAPADMPKEGSTNKDVTKHLFSLKGAPRDQVISQSNFGGCCSIIQTQAVKGGIDWIHILYNLQLLLITTLFKTYTPVFLPRFGYAFSVFCRWPETKKCWHGELRDWHWLWGIIM